MLSRYTGVLLVGESAMLRFRTKRRERDHNPVPENPQYEVAEFSLKHGLSISRLAESFAKRCRHEKADAAAGRAIKR